MPSANVLKRNSEPALDSNLLRTTTESERMRRNAVITFNRRATELRREAARIGTRNSQTSLSAREVWPMIDETNNIIQQAKGFFVRAKKFNAEGRLTSVLEDYIDALQAKYKALVALCVRRVQAENAFAENITAFANNAPSNRRIPLLRGGAAINTGSGPSRINFSMPRAQNRRTGNDNAHSMLQQAVSSVSRNQRNSTRSNNVSSAGRDMPSFTNTSARPNQAANNNRPNTANDRASMALNRRQMQRDSEHQEWQQDFWTGFERRLFARLDGLKKASKDKNSGGIGDLLGGALAGGLLAKVGKWMRGIGGSLMALLKKGKVAIAAGTGGILGAMMEGGAGIGRFFDDAEKALAARWSNLSDWFSKKFTEFNGMWDNSANALDETLKRWQGGMATAYDDVIKRVNTFIDDAGTSLDKLKDRISQGLEPVRDAFNKTGTHIGEFVDDVSSRLSKLPDQIKSLIPSAINAMDEWTSSISSKVAALKDSVKTGLSGATDEFLKFSGSIVDHAKSIGTAIGDIGDAAGNKISTALENVNSLVSKLSDAAKMAATTAASAASAAGVGSAASTTKAAAASVPAALAADAAGEASVPAGAADTASRPGVIARTAEAIGNVPGVKLAGKVIGGAAKVAGAGAGVPLDAALGAALAETNLGMAPGSATILDRGVGAAIGVGTSIASLGAAAMQAVTPNKFMDGTVERGVLSSYDKVFNPANNERAEILAHRIMAGNSVSAEELGTSVPFINLVRRSVMNKVDSQSLTATGWSDNQRVDASALPADLASAMRNPRSREFLANKANQATFTDVGYKIGESATTAIDNYATSLSNGTPIANVKANIPPEAAMLAEEIKSFINSTPAPSPVDLSGLRGAKLNLTQESSWAQLTSGQASPNQKRDAVEWMLANGVAPSDPSNPAYVETLGRLKASNKMIFEALSRSPDLEARSKGGIVVGGGSGVGAVGVTANGAAFSMSEKGSSEAIMPLVDGPQGLGVRSYQQKGGNDDGTVTIQPATMNLIIGESAAKELGKQVGEAIVEGDYASGNNYNNFNSGGSSNAANVRTSGVSVPSQVSSNGRAGGGVQVSGAGSTSGGGGGSSSSVGSPSVPFTSGMLTSNMKISGDQYNTFKESIAKIESNGKYDIMGGSSGRFAGRYQMGRDEINETARKLGVRPPSTEEFLKNPDMQETFFEAYTDSNRKQLMRNPKYANAAPEKQLEILGYAHNQGAGGASKWLNTGVVGSDAFNTAGTKYSTAIGKNLAQLANGGGTPATSSNVSYGLNGSSSAGGGPLNVMSATSASVSSSGSRSSLPALITQLQTETDPAKQAELKRQISEVMQAGAATRPPEATVTSNGDQKFMPGTNIPMQPDLMGMQLAEANSRTVNDLAGYQGGRNNGVRGISGPTGYIPQGFLPSLSGPNPTWGSGLNSLFGGGSSLRPDQQQLRTDADRTSASIRNFNSTIATPLPAPITPTGQPAPSTNNTAPRTAVTSSTLPPVSTTPTVDARTRLANAADVIPQDGSSISFMAAIATGMATSGARRPSSTTATPATVTTPDATANTGSQSSTWGGGLQMIGRATRPPEPNVPSVRPASITPTTESMGAARMPYVPPPVQPSASGGGTQAAPAPAAAPQSSTAGTAPPSLAQIPMVLDDMGMLMVNVSDLM